MLLYINCSWMVCFHSVLWVMSHWVTHGSHLEVKECSLPYWCEKWPYCENWCLYTVLQCYGNKQFIVEFDLISICGLQEKWQNINLQTFHILMVLDGSFLSWPHGHTGPTSPPASALSTSTDQAIQFMTALFATQAINPSLVSPIPTTNGVVHASPIVSQLLSPPSKEI